jgi:hypothetical protein
MILAMHRLLPFVLLPLLILAVLNLNLIKEAYHSGNVKAFVAYKLGVSGDSTTSCCNVADVLNSSGNFDETASIATFNSEIIDYPKTSLAYQNEQNQQVLGTTNASGEEKWVDVDLTKQWLKAMEGNRVVMEFPISSGLWGKTPIGDFNIWYKIKYTRMRGGSAALGTFYDLPNVPNNLFFYQGYALHGAYWHNNFGHPMSHGCVNEPLANAAAIFDWAGPNLPAGQGAIRSTPDNPGTRVHIHS